MRRDSRRREENNFKPLIYVSGGIIIIAVIAFMIGIVAFGNKVENDAIEGQFSTAKLSDLVPNVTQNQVGTEQASSSMGKTVNELENSMANSTKDSETTDVSNEENVEETESKSAETEQNIEIVKQQEDDVQETSDPEVKTEEVVVQEDINQGITEENTEDPVFTLPVEGEVIREFAKDKLVYSETLQEWIVHNGIDIKAEKTTVVKASASGKVSSIKNDPRYGLTITIEHNNGFKTVYANLLTAEFVTEGEVIEGGQTIGTVGNTATFEILDDPHLHFEMIKDGEYLDPSIYIK